MKTSIGKQQGFTLIELLVVIGIIGILAGMLMPSVVRAKQKAQRIKCLNSARQLGLSAAVYASDFDDELPPRRRVTNAWPTALKPYYINANILKCPADRMLESRSYLINGWNDYWEKTLSPVDYRNMMRWSYPHGMRFSDVRLPSDTILFGEKRIGSYHMHMDFGQDAGNDKKEVAQNMHSYGNGGKSGGSNFAFIDGSVRMLPYGGSVKPINLWAVTELWRSAPVDLP
jgi:prepilin-type N-terminal cleavage/methylation domain-containing protein/prepilin-type processing-associated H-X9-DG protein